MDLPLRRAIDQIIRDFQTTDEQATALEEMRSAHPHSVRLARLDTFCELPDGQTPEYDCFTFALDLIDCPERIAVREYAPRSIGPAKQPGIADALPGPGFLNCLLLPEQPSLQSCADGDLVVYRDSSGSAQHAGQILAGTIVSKWGMKGSLWQHGLWEVPSSYGTSARFYSHRPKEWVRQQWLVYLRRLSQRVSDFTLLVSVMWENRDRNFSSEELLRLAASRAPGRA